VPGVAGLTQDAQRAAHPQPGAHGGFASIRLVDEEKVGAGFQGERDGFGLAHVQMLREGADQMPVVGGHELEPCAERLPDGFDGFRVGQSFQFGQHGGGNVDASELPGQQVQPADDGQIGERRSVTDHGPGVEDRDGVAGLQPRFRPPGGGNEPGPTARLEPRSDSMAPGGAKTGLGLSQVRLHDENHRFHRATLGRGNRKDSPPLRLMGGSARKGASSSPRASGGMKQLGGGQKREANARHRKRMSVVKR